MILLPTLTVQVPEVTTALSVTFEPSAVTVNEIPVVLPPISGVE